MKVRSNRVKMFKIKNRRGYAAVCQHNLTEGRTVYQAYYRMGKALRRSGQDLEKMTASRVKRLVSNN